jgi:predicted metal-dependent enzyme (double-stranded beta helix superfamily)
MDLIDQFISDCRSALIEGQTAVAECTRLALADPDRFMAALQTKPKPWFFAADDELTVFCTEGRPGNASAPHNHGTWSVLGCFTGSEESWWHEEASEGGVTQVGNGVLRRGDVHALGSDAIHSVMNRWSVPNGVIHIYGGNFLAQERFIWDPVTGERSIAGLTEPLAPHESIGAPTEEANGATSGLGGTLFAALAVHSVDRVSTWLSESFGLTQLTNHDDSCAVEQFTYLIDPASFTIIGVHAYESDASQMARVGLDHLALRVPSIERLEVWRQLLADRGLKPSALTPRQFGTFVDVVGPEALRVRLFVPAIRPGL